MTEIEGTNFKNAEHALAAGMVMGFAMKHKFPLKPIFNEQGYTDRFEVDFGETSNNKVFIIVEDPLDPPLVEIELHEPGEPGNRNVDRHESEYDIHRNAAANEHVGKVNYSGSVEALGLKQAFELGANTAALPNTDRVIRAVKAGRDWGQAPRA